MAELKNMALSATESKQMIEPSAVDGPRYPYGLRLHLTSEVIDKLGLTGLPDVGATVIVYGRATVMSVSQHEQQDGEKQRNCELQLTDLCVENEPPKRDVAKSLYGT